MPDIPKLGFDPRHEAKLFAEIRKDCNWADYEHLGTLRLELLARRIKLQELTDAGLDRIHADWLANHRYDADRKATGMRRALVRARARHPSLGLPAITPPLERRAQLLKEEELPERLRSQIAVFAQGALADNHVTGAKALSQATIKRHLGSARMMVSDLVRAGLQIEPELGIEEISSPTAVDEFIRTARGRGIDDSSIVSVLSGMRRMSADILGPGHANVATLLARMGKINPGAALDRGKLKNTAALIRDFKSLWELPAILMGMAEDEGLSVPKRLKCARIALCLRLLIDHVWILPCHLASLHLERDLIYDGAQILIQAPSANREIQIELEPLTGSAVKLLGKLIEIRRRLNHQSPWLHPNRSGGPMLPRVARLTFYQTVTRHLGRPFKIQHVKDLAATLLLEEDPEATDRVANLLRLAHPRYVSQRFSAVINNPDPNVGPDHGGDLP